jgi:hypothetical protein
MDIIFNCPKCDVELAVDASGAGSAINCPECNEPITIPAAPAPPAAPPLVSTAHSPSAPPGPLPGSGPINAIATSAAAKIEHHFSVPVSDKPVEALVARTNKTVEPVVSGTKRVRVKTIRHSDCIEVGRDRFDEVVSEFIGKIGDTNVVSISPINYTHTEHGGDRLVTDYGLVIVYKG